MQIYDCFAPFYDLEYGHKDDDIDFYLDLAEKVKGPVLELGYGTGRIGQLVAGLGKDVLGIDNSVEMLKIARQNISGTKEEGKIRFYCGDMRYFALKQKFSLIIIPFRSFLHNLTLSDQSAALNSIKKHLIPGGILALDIFVPIYSVISRLEWDDEITPDELAESDCQISIKVHVTHEPENQILNISNTYIGQNGSKTVCTMRYRYIFRYEMEALLQAAGFQDIQVWGGFDRQPYNFSSGIAVFTAKNEKN
ncbi:class I SAM-dependent methyltransferase [candidate division KSB1 bacterium]|nr:class I SAM-dependent methyltransferase [candidate division KSB1 bacterium]